MTHDRISATVLIPTIGRPEMLRRCLESVAGCHPAPDEIVVLDQSHERFTAEVVASFADHGVRRIACERRGKGFALNIGLAEARNEVILITDDDCTVSPDWASAAVAGINDRPDTIVTGRVLGDGDPYGNPAQIDDPSPREYAGRNGWGTLYGGNMACTREPLQELGGFDERMVPAAEDDELSYRWVRSGRRIYYEPAMIVWHWGWRSPQEMRQRYVEYAYSLGVFYGEYLRQWHLRLLWPVARELYAGVRGVAAGLVRGGGAVVDPRLGILQGLPRGVVGGWRRAGSNRKSAALRRDSIRACLPVVRRWARNIRPVYLAWQLVMASHAALRDDAVKNRQRVESEFAVEDPWSYASSRAEQLCLRHQLETLDALRGTKKFRRACEVGCAEGVFTEMLADACESLVALDLSLAAVARAQKRLLSRDHVAVRQWDLRTDTLPGMFDLILVAGVLEYVHRRSHLASAVRKLLSALDVGGHLFVVTTRNGPAERPFWPALLPRGRKINEFVARQVGMRSVVETGGDDYIITVLQKQPIDSELE